MNRKKNTLYTLKKQVLMLKSQLQLIQRQKPKQKQKVSHNYNGQSSSRLNQSCYDSTFLDKGVKKFQLKQRNCKNIAQVIQEKSVVQQKPKLSKYRNQQNKKTRQNFSTEKVQIKTSRLTSPNPITGQGYNDKKKGIKTKFKYNHNQIFHSEKKTHKKHFSFHLYY